MGRPSSYTAKKAAAICDRLAAGESLRAICRDDDMPPESSVRQWVIDDVQGYAAQYAQARENGFDAIADEALEIANTPIEGVEIEESDQGTKVKRGDMLGHRRLQIDTRKWLLSKWSPKKYGERQALDLSNPDGTLAPPSDTVVAAKLAAILANAQSRKDLDESGADLV